jgi:hypothetical protein
MLSASEVESFVADGYVAIRGAVPADTVRACRDVIWSELAEQGVAEHDPATWTWPVVRIPARRAARSPTPAPGPCCGRRSTS